MARINFLKIQFVGHLLGKILDPSLYRQWLDNSLIDFTIYMICNICTVPENIFKEELIKILQVMYFIH